MDGFSNGAYIYSGAVTRELLSEALSAYRTYRADKESLTARIRDDDRFYRESCSGMSGALSSFMTCDTPFIFTAIENARADAIDNYPTANILERSPEGTKTAEVLSKIVPAQLEISEFKPAYKENIRRKLKYGTAVYGVFYNDRSGDIDIRSIDILDIYADMHVSDVQDSAFLFIAAAVENRLLREWYPEFAAIFTGDAEVESISESYRLRDRSAVLDCYYKKADGSVHMMKICKDTLIAATEDMEGYEHGLYEHGMYPVVFDVLYPAENCPFGYGMIDVGKATQTEINKLDEAITENIMCGAKPRYLSKRSGGIDEDEFRDVSKNIVHYEGDPEALKPIDTVSLPEAYISHRDRKKEELKEVLANRDFQQGSTSGGVTAASAIETLQQAGEKRSRALINDTYDSYKKIIYMIMELMRQFFEEKRVYRVSDEPGGDRFAEFSNEMMYVRDCRAGSGCGETAADEPGRAGWRKLLFDIDVVPQRESPYTRETANNTILTFWQNGLFEPENAQAAVIALKSMSFDGKERLIADIRKHAEAAVAGQDEQNREEDTE